MSRRPWPIKLLFLFHLIAPAINIVNSAHMSGVDVMTYMSYKLANSPAWELFILLFLLPIAGCVILACKKWSYYAYIGIMLIVFSYNYWKFQAYPHLFRIESLVGFLIFNFAIVGYFLIPAVRSVYFDRNMRWWEAAPRYLIDKCGQMICREFTEEVVVENISEGGAMLLVRSMKDIDKEICLQLKLEGVELDLRGRVAYQNVGFLGVQFLHTKETAKTMRKLINEEVRHKYPLRTPPPPIWQSFVTWLISLVDGQGFVPQRSVAPADSKEQ